MSKNELLPKNYLVLDDNCESKKIRTIQISFLPSDDEQLHVFTSLILHFVGPQQLQVAGEFVGRQLLAALTIPFYKKPIFGNGKQLKNLINPSAVYIKLHLKLGCPLDK